MLLQHALLPGDRHIIGPLLHLFSATTTFPLVNQLASVWPWLTSKSWLSARRFNICGFLKNIFIDIFYRIVVNIKLSTHEQKMSQARINLLNMMLMILLNIQQMICFESRNWQLPKWYLWQYYNISNWNELTRREKRICKKQYKLGTTVTIIKFGRTFSSFFLRHSRLLWLLKHLRLLWLLRDLRHLRSFATICDRLRPFVTICDDLWPFATVCDHLRLFVTYLRLFVTYLRLFATNLRLFAIVCECLRLFATDCVHFRPSATVFNHLRPFATICDPLRPFATICYS